MSLSAVHCAGKCENSIYLMGNDYMHDSSRLSLIWMGLYAFTYVCVDSSQTVHVDEAI